MPKTHPINGTVLRQPHTRPCAWPGCPHAGEYRAPKARDRLNDYHWFCLEHVRTYNAAWNYFEGMSDCEFDAMVRSCATWDRPTWPLGHKGHNGHDNGANPKSGPPQDPGLFWSARDSADRFREQPNPGRQTIYTAGEQTRMARLGPNERRALNVLSLDETATLQDVKKRYKQLVKRYHPDANGGTRHSASNQSDSGQTDQGAQERLRAIIEAYAHLVDSGVLMDPV